MNVRDLLGLQEAYLGLYDDQQFNESSIRNRARNAVADDRLSAAQQATSASMNRLRVQDRRHRSSTALSRAQASIAAKKSENTARAMHPNPGVGGHRIEQVDLYDIILSHLLDEGYATTPEAAQVILDNMSESWLSTILDESILDGVGGLNNRLHSQGTNATNSALERIANMKKMMASVTGAAPEKPKPSSKKTKRSTKEIINKMKDDIDKELSRPDPE
jgi:hypothetical protein